MPVTPSFGWDPQVHHLEGPTSASLGDDSSEDDEQPLSRSRIMHAVERPNASPYGSPGHASPVSSPSHSSRSLRGPPLSPAQSDLLREVDDFLGREVAQNFSTSRPPRPAHVRRPRAKPMPEDLSDVSPLFVSKQAGVRPAGGKDVAPKEVVAVEETPLQKQFERQRSAEPAPPAFGELEALQVLGEGAFGMVRLVRHVRTYDDAEAAPGKLPGSMYALKSISKARVLRSRHDQPAGATRGEDDTTPFWLRTVLNEKHVLERFAAVGWRHPFILHLIATYQDPAHLYLLTELVQGGELFALLERQPGGRLVPEQAAFYGACVASALAHLHERLYLYRDLKPENVLIDNQGYPKLADFGFAKEVRDKTFTMCGTPEYLAPEVLTNQGYAQPADCWSLGILLYEMMLGRSPFAGAASDKMRLFQLIIGAPADTKQLPPDAASIVDALLDKAPQRRLACAVHDTEAGDEDAARFCPFFDGIDWDALLHRQVHAPWVPAISERSGLASGHDSGRQSGRSSGRSSPTLNTEDEGQIQRLEQIFADWSVSGLPDDGKMHVAKPEAFGKRFGLKKLWSASGAASAAASASSSPRFKPAQSSNPEATNSAPMLRRGQ